MDKLSETLHAIYYNQGGPAALSGINALHKQVEKQLGHKVSRKKVQEWLNKQYVHLRHKRLRKPKGKRHRTVPIIRTNIHAALDCDLAQFDESKFRYGLTCVDQLSGKAYVMPMVNKSATTTAKAMQRLIDTQAKGKYPSSIRTDRGSEFYGAFNKLLSDKKVKHNFTDSNQKANYAESFIGKLRSKIEKARTVTGKRDWTQHWQNALSTLNSTPQARTEIAPNDVNESNLGVVFEHKMEALEKQMNKQKPQTEKFSVGTPVRISLTKSSLFQKSSKPSFSAEVFFCA